MEVSLLKKLLIPKMNKQIGWEINARDKTLNISKFRAIGQ